MILNLLLLMSIGILPFAALPFAAELMATYLRQSDGQPVAAAIDSGSFLCMSITFSALNRHILLGSHQLLTHAYGSAF